MTKFALAAVVAALVVSDASAFGRRTRGTYQKYATVTNTETVTTPTTATSSTSTVEYAESGVARGGLAQMKAEIQARLGKCFHPGGSLGDGTAEGCGFSSVSADHAIRSCCFYGRKQPLEIGVARGASGWHACIIYR